MQQIAGVWVDEQEMKGLALTVAMPDCPILDNDGTTEVPADDLPGFLARALGLDPAALSKEQGADIAQFITDYTL